MNLKSSGAKPRLVCLSQLQWSYTKVESRPASSCHELREKQRDTMKNIGYFKFSYSLTGFVLWP